MIFWRTKMYLYKITNKINNKGYIGITNDIQKRWSNEKSYPSKPEKRQVIQEAIHKYGKENFEFKVLLKNLSIENAIELEKKYIEDFNTLVPNGYNVHIGGSYHAHPLSKYGADNPNASLTKEEAEYILNNRDKPMYLLYEEFLNKISYDSFKKVYHHITYKNIETKVEEYPYNMEFSCQFTSGPLEYDDVKKLRERYSNGEYWKDVYKDYKWAYSDEIAFWNVYVGNRYKYVMPEVFTPESRHYHSSLSKQGSLNGRAKLTEKDVKKIRELWRNGITRKELYELYPQVNPTTIRGVINNKTWKNIL